MNKKDSKLMCPRSVTAIFLLFFLFSCGSKDDQFDATGTFEADELILSAEISGTILQMPVYEGQELNAGDPVALLDTTALLLQRRQIEATITAIGMKNGDPGPQIKVLQEQKKAADAQLASLQTQLEVLQKEEERLNALLAGNAVTTQQYDEISGKVKVMRAQLQAAEVQQTILDAQIQAAREQAGIQNRGINSEKMPLNSQLALIDHQLGKSKVNSPITGRVLTAYAKEHEFIAMGRPLIKMADLSIMKLNAFVQGTQLSTIQLGQKVTVKVDEGEGHKTYEGILTRISDQAEFTPKTIQTRDERSNQVYALEITVPNDGFLKIGMYGEVIFKPLSE